MKYQKTDPHKVLLKYAAFDGVKWLITTENFVKAAKELTKEKNTIFHEIVSSSENELDIAAKYRESIKSTLGKS